MRFVNTLGKPVLALGICARCQRKFPLLDLVEDSNSPGLMVCVADRDNLDPYRLPMREPDPVVLPFNRPDEPLT